GIDALVDEQGGYCDCPTGAERKRQVVADHEVPPEATEAPQVGHAIARSGFATRTVASEPRSRKAISASSAASSPGQCTPTPSPAQKMPNEVSRMPTANLSAFSGTRASGLRTTRPAATTSATAATAAIAARPIRCCAAPKVRTMKTTSSPSSSTPLNVSVN